ncbi:MAG: SIMPL domain-containing protein [Nodosilinea sp.]
MKPVGYSSVRRLTLALVAAIALGSTLPLTPVVTTMAMAQENTIRTLTVTGQGAQGVQTSKTQVSLGVDGEGKDPVALQQEVARRTTAVVELLRSRRVEKLETTGIQLSPRYTYDNQRSQLVGYSASNTVSFTLATESVGTLLDEAVKAGANQIRGIGFVATDEALEGARQQALKKAVADAQTQAAAVLGALNLRSQEVLSIQVNGAMAPSPIPMPMARQAVGLAQADATTPVIGGEQIVQATVTLQIRY